MSSESVCQVARSWVDVGSFHTRLFGIVYFSIASVREFVDTTSCVCVCVCVYIDIYIPNNIHYIYIMYVIGYVAPDLSKEFYFPPSGK
jgi:hypothetical protein